MQNKFVSHSFGPTLKNKQEQNAQTFFISEENGKVTLIFGDNKKFNCSVEFRADNGYTIVKAENGMLVDYINNPEDQEKNGTIGWLEEYNKVQATGDVITKRSKKIEEDYYGDYKIWDKKPTYAFVGKPNREGKESGHRDQIDEQTYLKLSELCVAHDKVKSETNSKFSSYISEFMGKSTFKDLTIDSSKYDSIKETSRLAGMKTVTVIGQNINEGLEDWIESRQDNVDEYRANGGIRPFNKEELNNNSRFLVNEEGKSFGISSNEFTQIKDFEDACKKEDMIKILDIENNQLDFIHNQILNYKNQEIERL